MGVGADSQAPDQDPGWVQAPHSPETPSLPASGGMRESSPTTPPRLCPPHLPLPPRVLPGHLSNLILGHCLEKEGGFPLLGPFLAPLCVGQLPCHHTHREPASVTALRPQLAPRLGRVPPPRPARGPSLRLRGGGAGGLAFGLSQWADTRRPELHGRRRRARGNPSAAAVPFPWRV